MAVTIAGESINERRRTRTLIVMTRSVYSSAEGGTMTACCATAAFVANVTQKKKMRKKPNAAYKRCDVT